MIFDSEVNAMQDTQTGLWSVFRLAWDESSIYPRRIDIANNLERNEVDKYLAWGNLQNDNAS
jgi:hypothetical protein